uniref:Uncharacterized protein n=1 Tax=Megaselia scalaris TaxID=36166 RepID=T1GLL2_MEGSC
MDRLEADEVLRFQCYSSIYLKTRDAVCYSGTSKFNRELAYRPDSWHQVKVMHNGDYSKEEILSAFFEIMRDTTFAPVSYYVGESLDSFVFPSSNKIVVKNMFRKSLKLTMPSGKPLHFSVTLGVAKTSSDQISLKKVLWKILDSELNKLRHYQGVKDVLFLEKLAIHPECRDICVSLGNPGTLQTLLEILITCFSKSVKNVKGINLRKNEITNLSSFKVLVEFVNELELLDLRCNEIPQESVAALRPLKIQNLLISKNRFSLSYDVLCLFGKELPYVIKWTEKIFLRILPSKLNLKKKFL